MSSHNENKELVSSAIRSNLDSLNAAITGSARSNGLLPQSACPVGSIPTNKDEAYWFADQSCVGFLVTVPDVTLDR